MAIVPGHTLFVYYRPGQRAAIEHYAYSTMDYQPGWLILDNAHQLDENGNSVVSHRELAIPTDVISAVSK